MRRPTAEQGSSRWKRSAVFSLVIAASGLAGFFGCQGRPRDPSPTATASASAAPVTTPGQGHALQPHVAELNISSGVPEVHSGGLLGVSQRRSFTELLDELHDIETKQNPKVRGVLVQFGSMHIGFARAQELSEALGKVRAAGLAVVCHGDEFNNASYLVAARGCDRLWVSPAGGVDTVGVAGQVLYAKRLLDQLKVDVNMLQVGRFKGTGETFTREGPSDEARESLVGVLRAMRTQWLEQIGASRSKPGVSSIIEQGPYSPQEAKDQGLIDQVGYLDQARGEALQRAGVENSVRHFGPGSQDTEPPALTELVRLLSGADGPLGSPHVAVIRASGSITMEAAGSMLGGSEGISYQELAVQLRKLRMDSSTRAVVLRLDSPGGSALASDLLWHELMELRQAKPLVVSVGDMAASGGYYMACAANKIVAEPASIVGSIGVVGGKFGVQRSLEHIGVNAELFPANDAPGAAQRAAYLSPLSSWDQPTQERVLSTMKRVYDLFVDRVSEGRHLPRPTVEGFAEGRIFSGRDGLALGMVDELGGLMQAIEHARKLGGLDAEAPVRLIEEEHGIKRLLEDDEQAAQDDARSPLGQLALIRATLRSSAPDLLVYVNAYGPLLQGEHTLVAVPFALLIR